MCNHLAPGTGFREACELAYKELEAVCLNNSSNPQRFRQVCSPLASQLHCNFG